MEIVLFQPDIPQNTGNIARSCVAVGAKLTLISPLGFSLSDKYLKRAGMDYWEKVDVSVCNDIFTHLKNVPSELLFFFSTKARVNYFDEPLPKEGIFIFGSETSGLPKEIRERWPERFFTIPMQGGIRSLNLATSVGIILYDCLRQNFSILNLVS